MRPSPPTPPHEPGAEIGPYTVESLIGTGALAHVYQARGPDGVVALKVLGSELAEDIARFDREARATQAVSHPNVVQVVDWGEDQGTRYIAMELVTGETLADVLKREKALSVRDAVHVARQICAGLGAAHERGLLHRDLKPSNILITRRGFDRLFVKVVDFGLVKRIAGFSSPQSEELTDTGQLVGSPLYIAPEQIRGRDPAPQVDVYSLGVLLYRMVTGRLPYKVTGAIAAVVAHLHSTPIPPSERAPDRPIPTELEAILFRCLEKEPAERYPSMAALDEALEAVPMEQVGETARLGAAALGLAGVIGLGVLIWWLRS